MIRTPIYELRAFVSPLKQVAKAPEPETCLKPLREVASGEPRTASGRNFVTYSWTSKRVQNNGPISQNREYR